MTIPTLDTPVAVETVTVYTKPACVQCDMTKKWLETRGIPFETEDLLEPDNLAAAKSLGYMSAPVILAGEHHFAGFNINELNNILARRNAALATTETEPTA